MRKLIVLPVAALTAALIGTALTVLTGLALGYATPSPTPVLEQMQIMVAAKGEAGPEAGLESFTGKALSVDKGARRMTLKQSGWFTSREVTFAVAEPAVPMLAEIQPGDRVTVDYAEAHDQLIVKTITEVPAERETRQFGRLSNGGSPCGAGIQPATARRILEAKDAGRYLDHPAAGGQSAIHHCGST